MADFFKTIIEPFKIKVVEPIKLTSRGDRERALKDAGYNLFNIPSEMVLIDCLTDSGTAAMSAEQWGEIMTGDEAYAGSRSFYKFLEVVRGLTGYKHIIPTHQGRAAERIFCQVVLKSGSVIPANTHFDTTRANIEYGGGIALDLVIGEAHNPSSFHPFKGNMDIKALEELLSDSARGDIPFILMTITNNGAGGQPVSMENLRAVSELSHHYGIPLILDAARFAENAFFIKEREPGYDNHSVKEIAKEIFGLADGCMMSAKKDGLVNIGGFLALNNDQWAEEAKNLLILTEGFPTYGGLAGRDLAALAKGLQEVLEEDYLRYRIRSVKYLGEHLTAIGVPIVQPPGGHAIYIDARAFLNHIPPSQYPGQALAAELYVEGGIRGVEMGSVMFGKRGDDGKEIPAPLELVRLAFPRRVYTQSHVDYMLEVFERLVLRRHLIPGIRITREAKYLRHFSAEFEIIPQYMAIKSP